MHPLLLVAIPVGLVILGMILNSIDLGFSQPPSSTESDPVKKLTAEKSPTVNSLIFRETGRSSARSGSVSMVGW